MVSWAATVVCLMVAIEPSWSLDEASKKMMQTIDPAPMIANKQMVQSFMDCFMDRGRCNPIAAQIKKNIGEVLAEGCASCPEEQRALIKSVLAAFIPTYPEEWKEFLHKYDPENKQWPILKAYLGLDNVD